MPTGWQDDAQRLAYYGLLPQPVTVTSFTAALRARLTAALTQFNRALPQNPYVHLSTPAANEDRRLFAVERLTAQPEPQSLGRLKDLIGQRYGMLVLLDIFAEADRLTGFTQFFTHSGTQEVRSVRRSVPSCSLTSSPRAPTPGSNGSPMRISPIRMTNSSMFGSTMLRSRRCAWPMLRLSTKSWPCAIPSSGAKGTRVPPMGNASTVGVRT